MRRVAVPLLILFAIPHLAPAQSDSAARRLERDILQQLIEINTSDSAAHTMDAAQAMARRLIEAGIPAADVQVLQPVPTQGMLVARYRGTGEGGKPILLMAHLDVVDARKEDWSFDPYVFREVDGYYYGRGTSDNKAGAAMLVANFIRYKAEGFVPKRDIVVVLSSDEETVMHSIQWIATEHRDLIDAAYALNTDGGGGELRTGKPVTFSVQAAEKVYQSFQFEVRNKGGQSSLPVPDNAIYRLSEGLARLAKHHFPVRLNDVSRSYFERSAAAQDQRTAADMRALVRNGSAEAAARLSASVPFYNSVMRTTCVATRLYAGHANNALPQLAQAVVNCRILPDEPIDSVEAELNRVVADSAIRISRIDEGAAAAPASPLLPEVMGPVESLVKQMWPGAAVIPEMSTGATDGLHLRRVGIPVFGISAIFEEVGDTRAHGRDERVGVKAYHDASRFWYTLVKQLGSQRPGA